MEKTLRLVAGAAADQGRSSEARRLGDTIVTASARGVVARHVLRNLARPHGFCRRSVQGVSVTIHSVNGDYVTSPRADEIWTAHLLLQRKPASGGLSASKHLPRCFAAQFGKSVHTTLGRKKNSSQLWSGHGTEHHPPDCAPTLP